MKSTLNWITAWIAASIGTFVLASIAHSQFVLIELIAIDIQVPLADWLRMTLDDLVGLSLTYGLVITLTMLLCFGILSLIHHKLKSLPVWFFVLGGGLAIAIMLLAMQPLLNVTLIAGARTSIGFLCQCIAGVLGGWVFARLCRSI